MPRPLIAVIGAGNVGATCALTLAQMKIADIVLLDIHEGVAKGKALDMSQNGTVLNYDGRVTGTSSYQDIAGADVVVVTSGFPRQPGMTREDLIGKNAFESALSTSLASAFFDNKYCDSLSYFL